MDIETLSAENQALRDQNAALVDKLESLSLELARLKKQVFGQKSERRPVGDDAQVGLFQVATASDEPEAPAPTRRSSSPRSASGPSSTRSSPIAPTTTFHNYWTP